MSSSEQQVMDEFFETREYDVPGEDWKDHPELGVEEDEEVLTKGE